MQSTPYGVTAVISLVTIVSIAPAHAATPLTACGESVVGKAVLTADLDCSGQPLPAAVRLAPGATLDLAGFTLRGGIADAVVCQGSCKVVTSQPGGMITDAGGNGINANGDNVRGGNVLVNAVVISGNGLSGIEAAGRVKLFDSTLSDNGANGVNADGGKIIGSAVARNGVSGVAGGGNWRVSDTVVEDNAQVGVAGFNIKVKSSIISGNRYGVSATYIGVKDSTVADNGIFGARAWEPQSSCHLTVQTSTITGNGFDPSCIDDGQCGDVGACKRPNVNASTCSSSFEPYVPGASWGVCVLD